MSYDWIHFSGFDYDSRKKEQGIFKFIAHGKRNDWVHNVNKELGNYHFLWVGALTRSIEHRASSGEKLNLLYFPTRSFDRMFADLDHSHPALRSDIFSWDGWITSTSGLGGMRLDAMKHYSFLFVSDFISHLDKSAASGKRLFFVDEYWDGDTNTLEKIVKRFRGRLNLFDVQLWYKFGNFSKSKQNDLRTIFDETLLQRDQHMLWQVLLGNWCW